MGWSVESVAEGAVAVVQGGGCTWVRRADLRQVLEGDRFVEQPLPEHRREVEVQDHPVVDREADHEADEEEFVLALFVGGGGKPEDARLVDPAEHAVVGVEESLDQDLEKLLRGRGPRSTKAHPPGDGRGGARRASLPYEHHPRRSPARLQR